ncbi:hypothetical protein B0G84_5723 [Paraburkholderia sp. BL8N3]|nr:hypothetical protein [Paraburkholderia sp. BL8N3]TCK36710.1 hypothetical protein B0G84_5723 [Paraburkholderia sp. BL8N3]
MQKKPTYQSPPHAPLNGRATPAVLGGTGTKSALLLGRAVLLRHPLYARGAQTIAALIVGTYTVDERYVVVQAFPIGKPSSQLADVQLVEEDPGETNEAVAWLVK